MLGFLGLKVGGRNPEFLSNVVQPVLELQQWYHANYATILNLPSSVTGTGFQTPTGATVPDDRWWLLDLATIEGAALGAGQSISFAIALNFPPANVLAITGMNSVTTVGDLVHTIKATSDFWVLPPKTQIGWYVTRLVAGPIAVTLRARISEFPG